MVDVVVSYVVQRLGDYLIQEANLLHGVRDEVEWLKTELGWMQSFLKDAEKKQAGDERVRKWACEIRDIAYDTEDVLDTFILQVGETSSKKFSCSFGICTCIPTQPNFYKIAKDIEKIKNRLIDISRKRDIYGLRDIAEPLDRGRINGIGNLKELRRSSSYVDQECVVGFEDDSSILLAELLKEEPRRCVISILGMGGLGKTTAARMVYRSGHVAGIFHCRAWVSVSQEYEPKDVLLRVIKSFKSCTQDELGRIEKLDLEDMERHLRTFLAERRYLVVIDDVWQREAWESLRQAFPDNSNGSRVIITTRNKNVAERCDERTYVHKLRFLREDESWNLFQKKVVFLDNDYTNDMELLGREMVGKCRGLPLAIIILGGLLSTKKTLQEWQLVRDHLWKHLRNDSIHISMILSLSFDDLPMELKPCFLFLGLYPEDFVIGTDILIRLWVEEGFISQEEETMEKVAEYYINDLVNRSMLHIRTRDSTRVVECQIHDLVRDLAIQKAKEINFLSIYDGKTRSISSSSTISSNACRRLAIHGVNLKPESLKNWNANLRTLMLFGDETEFEFIKFVCSRFKLLRILDVRSGPYGEPSKKWILPQEIQNLVNLRFLRFGGTLIRELPTFLPHLKNLQTLMLRGEFFLEHSNDKEVSMLKKLRHLRHIYVIGKNLSVSDFPDIQSWGFNYNEIWQNFYS